MVVPALAALATGFVAFCKRFNVTPPKQLALIAGGAVLAREALRAIDKEVDEWAAAIQKDIDQAKSVRPGVSGTGGTAVNLGMSDERLKEIIAAGESRGDYNTVYGEGVYGSPEANVGKKLTDMTVAEVIDYQERYLIPLTAGRIGQGNLGTGAVGKYQIVNSTLKDLVKQGVLSPNEPFSPSAQERAGTALISGIRKKSTSDADFSNRINATWQGAHTTVGPTIDAAAQTEAAVQDVMAGVSALQRSIDGGPERNVGNNLNRQSQDNNTVAPRRSPLSQEPVVVTNNNATVDNKAVESRTQQKARTVKPPHGPDMPVDR